MICRFARSPFGGAVERSETERAAGADVPGGPLCDLLQRQTGRFVNRPYEQPSASA